SFFFPRQPVRVRDRMQRRLPWISHGALLISLLWVVHPVHSAAVDYISGRADSLSFFFAAAAWLLYIQARGVDGRALRRVLYTLAAVSGIIALLSREIACIWMLLFLIHLFCIEKNIPLRVRVATLLCCLSLVGIYAGLRQLPGQRPTAPSQAGWSAPVRATLMVRALGDYGRLLILPGNLHMERSLFDPTTYRSN